MIVHVNQLLKDNATYEMLKVKFELKEVFSSN